MHRRFSLASALLASLFVAASISAARADEATLAAPAGFRKPLTELATAYEAQSGNKILQVYGHVGQVVTQAKESAQITVVCGDKATLHHADGLHFERMVRLGTGKLVLAFRRDLKLAKAEDIAQDDIKRIGIPDQTAAIYGKAGRQFLERAHLAQVVDPKLVAVATVPQVTSYIASGEIDAGFINATDAIGAGDTIGGFVQIDTSLYDPVEISCGIRTADKPSPATTGFAEFLETDQARKILDRYGL